MKRCLLVVALVGGPLLSVPPAAAAVIESRSVELRPAVDGYVEIETLRVRLVELADTSKWARYPIYLDEGIELVDLVAEVLSSGGGVREKVPRRKLEEVGGVGDSLYSSGRLAVIPFPALRIGESLRIEVTRRYRPVFPAAVVSLGSGDPAERLRVRVAEGFPDLRWQLRAPADAYQLRPEGAGLELVAEGLEPTEELAFVPDGDAFPTLHLAWGPDASWPAVGQWYDGFAPADPRPAPAVQALAEKLTSGLEEPRARVEALARHVQELVRYEAVQIGEGGWRPSPAAEVVARGWGDCKDKSRLLLDLLGAVGIPGHMALLRAGYGEAVGEDLASPFQFNHAIVALPAAAAGASPEDPVADGLLWIDPTATEGGIGWLLPTSQDRPALLIDGASSRLVRTATAAQAELLRLDLEGSVAEDGTFSGIARLVAAGAGALPWLSLLEGRDVAQVEDSFTRLVRRRAPGAELGALRWGRLAGAVPAVGIEAPVTVTGLVRGEAGHRWLRPGSLEPLPEPRTLEDRSLPVALRTGLWRTAWRLELPEGWCPPQLEEASIDNSVGRWLDRLSLDAEGRMLLEREVEIRRQRVEGEALTSLAELAIAENRAARGRVRLRCQEPSALP